MAIANNVLIRIIRIIDRRRVEGEKERGNAVNVWADICHARMLGLALS